jgi:hypothetical protein
LANPSRYVVSYNFSAFQETQPSTPLPAVQVDVQLADIQTSTTELRDAIMDIRRSDGALMNGIVTEDSLAADLLDQLLAESRADEAAASAAAAAASADEAEAATEENLALQTTLEAAIDAFENNGFYADWGDWHSEPGASSDWGNWA